VRYLAVGDIHGCFTALRTLEAAVPFTPDDVLVTLGDYRGPWSEFLRRARLVDRPCPTR